MLATLRAERVAYVSGGARTGDVMREVRGSFIDWSYG
jgi:hypothetical protein